MYCLQCGLELSGRKSKFCSKEHGTRWRHKHLYNYKWQTQYRGKSVRNYLSQIRSYYNRKETLSLDFLVDLYFSQDGKCALSGVQMTHIQGSGRIPTNISIDRLDNNLGYTPTNVQLVCHRVNLMRNENTYEELLDWCDKILNYKQDPHS